MTQHKERKYIVQIRFQSQTLLLIDIFDIFNISLLLFLLASIQQGNGTERIYLLLDTQKIVVMLVTKEKAAARRELKDHYDDDIIEKEGPRRLCRPKSTERQQEKKKYFFFLSIQGKKKIIFHNDATRKASAHTKEKMKISRQ